MASSWLEIRGPGEPLRAELGRGLTRVGGQGADIVLPGLGGDELHVWTDPPKLVHVAGPRPEVHGEPVEEHRLETGLVFRWAGHELAYGRSAEVLEEIPLEAVGLPAAAPTGPAVPAGPADSRAWQRVRAGLVVDLGLAERKHVKRWQESVLHGGFDPDQAAAELCEGVELGPDDPRLVERSGRLLRDFLMASFQRGVQGAGRRARAAARSGLAMVIAQGVAIAVYTVILLVIALLSRVAWDFSVDALLDAVAGR